MPSPNTLILFTRFPEAGKTKTRLIPALGAEGAAELQRKMTEELIHQCNHLHEYIDFNLKIYFQGGSKSAMKTWLGNYDFIAQPAGNLGDRLIYSINKAFSDGNSQKIIIIGSDCPGISPAILAHAFEELNHKPLVLGPASDGGYYLIAMSEPFAFLFNNINWGSEHVLHQTISLARKHKLTLSLLDPLNDIDRPEDIKYFHYNSNS